MMVTKKNVMLFEEFHAQKALNEGKKKECEDDDDCVTLTKDEESDLLDIEDLIDIKKLSLAKNALEALKKANKEINKNSKFIKVLGALERASGKKK